MNASKDPISQLQLLRIYETAICARKLDVELGRRHEEYFPKIFYSGFGSEVGPASLGVLLHEGDVLFPQFRGLATFIGRGISLPALVGELYGRQLGTAKGFGDTCAFADSGHGIPGYSISLGGGFGVAIGRALSMKRLEVASIVAIAFGDGEASRTTFASALSIASLWELPLLFVCLNNKIAIETKAEEMSPVQSVLHVAKGYGISGETLDELDSENLMNGFAQAIRTVREKKKPFIIELIQRRVVPHSTVYASDPAHRPVLLRGEDCIAHLREHVVRIGISNETLDEIDRRLDKDITKVFQGVCDSPPPTRDDYSAQFDERI